VLTGAALLLRRPLMVAPAPVVNPV
jgi:hypothetical protein